MSWLSDAASSVANRVSSTASSVSNTVSNTASAMSSTVASAATRVSGVASNAYHQTADAVSDFSHAAVHKATDLGRQGLDAGRRALDTVSRDVSHAASVVKTAAEDAGHAVEGAAESSWNEVKQLNHDHHLVERGLGGLRAVGGGLEVAAGASLFAAGVATSEIGIGFAGMAGGAVIMAHGADQTQAGVRQAIDAHSHDSFTSEGLQAAGLSPGVANGVDAGASIVFGLGGGAAAKGITIAGERAAVAATERAAVGATERAGAGVAERSGTQAAERGSEAWFADVARGATRNPDSDRLVLGHFAREGASYQKVAAHYDATYFKVENWSAVTKGMSQDQIWRINETFLTQQIKQGKQILFSHNPAAARPGSFFEREVDFLKDLGYSFTQKNQWTWEAAR